MLPIQTILHPTDFSASAGNAFRLACALAQDYHARLVVLHVNVQPIVVYGEGVIPVNPEELKAQAKERLAQMEADHPEDAVEYRLEEGDAVAEILRTAEAIAADVILMGTHGRTGLSRLLMGSVAEQVVRKAPCPVVTIKMPMEAVHATETVPGAAVHV